jgi:hypothetical protein
VAVGVDGGCLQTRAAGYGPGVHEQGWKEDKVACLHTLAGPTFTPDPHPDPPACFLDPPYVEELVQDLKSHKRLGEEDEAVDAATEPPGAGASSLADVALASLPWEETPPAVKPSRALADQPNALVPLSPEEPPPTVASAVDPSPADAEGSPLPAADAAPPRKKKDWPPQRLVRTCVATQQSSATFGPLVAEEAYRRGFFAAPRRAFLGDGQKYNWTIQQKWFKDFVAIADFIHPLSYLYVAATAVAQNLAERWELYQGWMTACWQGRVAQVLTELQQWQERLGPIGPAEKPPGSDARVVVGKAVTHLHNNQARMDYARYRRLGLPVTSSAVASLIKEFNYRVKGAEKFWNRPEGTERILQVRAAVLSEDDRLSKHVKNRPGNPQRRYRAKDEHQ